MQRRGGFSASVLENSPQILARSVPQSPITVSIEVTLQLWGPGLLHRIVFWLALGLSLAAYLNYPKSFKNMLALIFYLVSLTLRLVTWSVC